MEPSKKSPAIENFLEKLYGRSTAIRGNQCIDCGCDAIYFSDELSREEYKISGLCQDCQNEIWDGEVE